MEDLSKLTVAVLRKRLTERDLPTTGLKAELIARLQDAIQADQAAGGQGRDKEEEEEEQQQQQQKDQPNEPVKRSTPQDAVQADAIVDARVDADASADDVKRTEDSQQKPPTALGAIHDAHAAGVEAVGVTHNGIVEGHVSSPEKQSPAAVTAATTTTTPTTTTTAKQPPSDAAPKSTYMATAPDDAVPLAALDPPYPPTRAVRVTGLVRPIMDTVLRQVAGKFGELDQSAEPKGGVWVDGIKSQGWIVYNDVSSAQSLLAEFNGKPFPLSQPFRTPVVFFYVPADVVPAIIAQEEALWQSERARMQVVAAVRGTTYEFGARRRDATASAKPGKKDRPAKAEQAGVTAVTPASTATAPPPAEQPTTTAASPPATGISILGAGRKAQGRTGADAQPAGTGNGTIPYADASSLPPVTFPPVRERQQEAKRSREPAREPSPVAPTPALSHANSLAARLMEPRQPRGGADQQKEETRRGARGKAGRELIAREAGVPEARYHPYAGREREREREREPAGEREYGHTRDDGDYDRSQRSQRSQRSSRPRDVDLNTDVEMRTASTRAVLSPPPARTVTYAEHVLDPALAAPPPIDERTTASRSNAAAAYASRARGGEYEAAASSVPTGPRADRGGGRAYDDGYDYDREYERDARGYRERARDYARDRGRGRGGESDRERERGREYGYDRRERDRDRDRDRDWERNGRGGGSASHRAYDAVVEPEREHAYEGEYDYRARSGGYRDDRERERGHTSRGYDRERQRQRPHESAAARTRQASPGWRMEPPLPRERERGGERGGEGDPSLSVSGRDPARDRPRRERNRGAKGQGRERERYRQREHGAQGGGGGGDDEDRYAGGVRHSHAHSHSEREREREKERERDRAASPAEERERGHEREHAHAHAHAHEQEHEPAHFEAQDDAGYDLDLGREALNGHARADDEVDFEG